MRNAGVGTPDRTRTCYPRLEGRIVNLLTFLINVLLAVRSTGVADSCRLLIIHVALVPVYVLGDQLGAVGINRDVPRGIGERAGTERRGNDDH